MRNPYTGREIIPGGPTYRKLLRLDPEIIMLPDGSLTTIKEYLKTFHRLSSELIGEGGEASIYPYGPHKVIRVQDFPEPPEFYERSNTIATRLSQLPWFIGYFGLKEFRTVEDTLVIGEVYERGQTTLGDAIEQRLLSDRDIISVLACILIGLKEARDTYNFNHRDLHVYNIVVVPNGDYPLEAHINGWGITEYKYSPRIIDFGSVSITLEDGLTITAASDDVTDRNRDVNNLLTDLIEQVEKDFPTDHPLVELLTFLQQYQENIDAILMIIADRYPRILRSLKTKKA